MSRFLWKRKRPRIPPGPIASSRSIPEVRWWRRQRRQRRHERPQGPPRAPDGSQPQTPWPLQEGWGFL